jgi:tRNA nucleotidyltransferase (CCA-adding enzyme)
MIEYPHKLDIIFTKLKHLNIRPVIVGGYIRDSLLGKDSKDIDIELYGIASLEKVEEVLEEFGNINNVGKSFGVCKLLFEELDLDFSLPRLETKISSGHKGFSVSTYSNLNFETASSRRDFTINAIGFDVEKKIILDPHNGMTDLKNKTLHFVNKATFIEDPLRILRGVQFSSRYNLAMSYELFELCKEMIRLKMLHELPSERIFDEIKKLLLESPKPSLGLTLLKNLGALSFFDELLSLSEDMWHKTLLALDEMVQYKTNNDKRDMILMLSLLSFSLDEKKVFSFTEKLTHEKKILSAVANLTKSRIHTQLDDAQIYRLAIKTNIENTVFIHLAFYPQRKEMLMQIYNKAEKLGVLREKIPALLHGRDLIALGIHPSKSFSEILAYGYEAQMDGVFKTHEEALHWLKKELLL